MTDPQPEAPAIPGGPLVLPQDEFGVLQDVARKMGALAMKPCGCGPEEPCEAHADTSLPVDWQGRAEAAEARLAAAVAHCRENAELATLSAIEPPEAVVTAASVLAIIGGEEAPLRTSDQWAVAWGSKDVNDGIGRVEEYDDQEDAAEHLGLYGDGACVVSREVRWGPWRRVPAADEKGADHG